MEIRITRGKEFLKKGSIKFTLAVETVSLSGEEQALVQKYGDPLVYAMAASDLNQYADAKIAVIDDVLSKLKVNASMIGRLRPIKEYEEALVESLGQRLAYLRAVDLWEGEEILSV